MRLHSQSMKVSSALRRIGNMRGRSRQEWREAREASDAVYAAEVCNMARAPRLRKAAKAERREWRAIPLAEFLSASPAFDTPHSVTLPTRDRISYEIASPDAAEAFWQAAQRGI
jgi:hypothetical protein